MRTRLQILALFLGLAGVVVWLALGANRGWTKTKVPVKTLDEVTGLEGIDYRKRFVPGLDFIGGALAGAAFIYGLSFAVRSRAEP